MKRRNLLKAALIAPLLPWAARLDPALNANAVPRFGTWSRVRPGDAGWPGVTTWEQLRQQVGGRLLQLRSPFASGQYSATYVAALGNLDNPFALGDDPALTQTSGWADAWRSQPSAYAVAAESAADVVAAVSFARHHRLRLVVKGGGHSYQGTSQAADSLLVWTRRMNHITLHDHFVPDGCVGAGTAAVTVQAGALWIDVYDAVTTRGGRYVQGGGCTSVGVAGLVNSGGFGNFSKRFGTAAGNLLQARVVTADGIGRTVNAARDPELFWAIKGGGGGNFGVITELTLRTFDLPEWFGAVFGRIKAKSPEALRALISKVLHFYRESLFNAQWGEQIAVQGGDSVQISLVFQGIDKAEAQRIWAPFVAWVQSQPDYRFVDPLEVVAIPAQHFWDIDYFRQHLPGLMIADDRPGAAAHRGVWAGDRGQVGWFIRAYQSVWLPQSLLAPTRVASMADALFSASQQWDVALHFNKGLGGGDAEAIARSRDTATHPGMTEAFALAICAAGSGAAFPGMPTQDHSPTQLRHEAAAVGRAIGTLRELAPQAGSYVSESDYFLDDWQNRFWGKHYPRLLRAKRRYDPDGLFFAHHGIGSDAWSPDGFTRLGT